MELAKDSLEIKRKLLENLTDKELYPYTKFYLRDIKALFIIGLLLMKSIVR